MDFVSAPISGNVPAVPELLERSEGGWVEGSEATEAGNGLLADGGGSHSSGGSREQECGAHHK